MAPRNRDAKRRRERGDPVPKDRTKPKRFRGVNVLGQTIRAPASTQRMDAAMPKKYDWRAGGGFSTVTGEDFEPMGRSAIKRKIKLSAVKGEVAFEMGKCGDPLLQKTLYAQLCPDAGDWALVLRPESLHLGDTIQLTSLPDGAIMVKVIRR